MNKKRITLLTAVLIVGLTGIAFASGDGGHADGGVLMKDFMYRCFNFAIAFGILAFFITKPIKKGLADRTSGIADQLAEAKKVKEESEARFAEYDNKLKTANEEIETLRLNIVAEGKAEKERIVESAKVAAEKIKAEAKKSAEVEVARAALELKQEAVIAAIAMAEVLLKKNFTADDQARLVEEYSSKVGGLH